MSNGGFLTLGSIEAARPVFMIVMGCFMLLFAWRLASISKGWTARVLMAGALLLAFGYAVMLPLYQAGILEFYAPARSHYQGSVATALGWHVTKMVVMNTGWLVLGIGLAMHAKLLGAPAPRTLREIHSPRAHESIV